MNIDNRLLTMGVARGRSGRVMVPKGVVVHYVANPGSSALGNRNYFENGSGGAGVSAHYVIGLNGEIIRCIPDNECSAHAGKSYGPAWDEMAKTNNSKFIGIECCHPNSDGKFNDYTIDSLVDLVADLCNKYSLDPKKDVYRHFDVCGKMCPLYYVNNKDHWDEIRSRIQVQFDLITKGTAPAAKPAATAPVSPAPAANPAPAASNTPSDWAVDAWAWVKLNGLNDGTRPKDVTTREEVANFMYNFFYKIIKK